MGIGQNVIIIPNQQLPQHLPINLILQFLILWLWVQSEKFHQMKPRDRWLELFWELFETLVVREGGECGKRFVEDFYYEFGNVRCFALAFLWLLDQLRDDVLVWG